MHDVCRAEIYLDCVHHVVHHREVGNWVKMGKDGERWERWGRKSGAEMEKWGKMGNDGETWGRKKGPAVDVCLLCFFVLLIVLCFTQEHHPSWLGMGMDIVLCPLPSYHGTPCYSQGTGGGGVWDQKSVKNGSKMCFSKDTFGLFGVHKQAEPAHFEPMLSKFGPSQGRKGLENGPIWDHKRLKNGSKPWFSKNDPSLVVVPKRMNIADFEPPLSCSHPLSSVYLIVVEVSWTMFLPPSARSQ